MNKIALVATGIMLASSASAFAHSNDARQAEQWNKIDPAVQERLALIASGPRASMQRMCNDCSQIQNIEHFPSITPTTAWPGVGPRVGADEPVDARNEALAEAFEQFTDFSALRKRHLPYDTVCKRCRRTHRVMASAARAFSELYLPGRITATFEEVRAQVTSCTTCDLTLAGARSWKVFFDSNGSLVPGAYCLHHARALSRRCLDMENGRLENCYILEAPKAVSTTQIACPQCSNPTPPGLRGLCQACTRGV